MMERLKTTFYTFSVRLVKNETGEYMAMTALTGTGIEASLGGGAVRKSKRAAVNAANRQAFDQFLRRASQLGLPFDTPHRKT